MRSACEESASKRKPLLQMKPWSVAVIVNKKIVSMFEKYHHVGRFQGLKIALGDPEMLRRHQPPGCPGLRAIFP